MPKAGRRNRSAGSCLNRLASEITKILRDPAMRDTFARDGYEAIGSTPEEYLTFYRAVVAL